MKVVRRVSLKRASSHSYANPLERLNREHLPVVQGNIPQSRWWYSAKVPALCNWNLKRTAAQGMCGGNAKGSRLRVESRDPVAGFWPCKCGCIRSSTEADFVLVFPANAG